MIFSDALSPCSAADASFGEFQSGTFSASMTQQSTTVTNIQAQVSSQPLQQATPMPAAAPQQQQQMSNAAMLMQPQPLQPTQVNNSLTSMISAFSSWFA